MRSKLKSRVGSGEQLFAFLLACILLLGGATLIRADVVTIVLTCSAVSVVAAITRLCLPYFRPETFGRGNALKRLARKSHGENSHEVNMVNREERISKADCSMSDNRRDGDLKHESLLDAAVERICRGIQRDLEVRK
jgi:hypothetical protein